MDEYWAEVISPTGVASLPVGTVARVITFNHVAFVGAPSIALETSVGPISVPASCLCVVAGAEAKALRQRARDARRANTLTAREGRD